MAFYSADAFSKEELSRLLREGSFDEEGAEELRSYLLVLVKIVGGTDPLTTSNSPMNKLRVIAGERIYMEYIENPSPPVLSETFQRCFGNRFKENLPAMQAAIEGFLRGICEIIVTHAQAEDDSLITGEDVLKGLKIFRC